MPQTACAFPTASQESDGELEAIQRGVARPPLVQKVEKLMTDLRQRQERFKRRRDNLVARTNWAKTGLGGQEHPRASLDPQTLRRKIHLIMLGQCPGLRAHRQVEPSSLQRKLRHRASRGASERSFCSSRSGLSCAASNSFAKQSCVFRIWIWVKIKPPWDRRF